MNRRETAVLLCSLLVALPAAVAQSPQPNVNAGAPAVAAAPAAAKRTPSRASVDTGPDADARACLELATNPEIARCAEKYRPHRRNA